MPISGSFTADFSKFNTAVEQAQTKLVSFQTTATKVPQSLERIEESLSGKKLIQNAVLMAEAVQRIGGVSKLTEAELARLGAQAQEAVAKMRAMGIDVPGKLQAVADAAGKTGGAMQGLTTASIAVGTAIGNMAAQAVTALTHLAVDGIQRVVSELGRITLEGAGVGDVEENFNRMAAAAGQLGTALMTTLRTATHNTINDFELMKTVNADLAAGMNLTKDQFATMAQGAFALAQATGGDVKQALDTMNDALLTGRTRAVEMLTGQIDLQSAEDKYARALNTTREKLTDAQKLEADRIAILNSITAATKRLGDQTDGLDEKVAQAITWWENFEHQLGKVLANSPVMVAALDTISQIFQQTFGTTQEDQVVAVAQVISDLAVKFVGFAEYVVSAGKAIAEGFYLIRAGAEQMAIEVVARLNLAAAAMAKIFNLASYLPNVGAGFSVLAAKAHEFAQGLGTIVTGLAVERDAALGSMDQTGAAFDGANAKLETLRLAMEKASHQPIVTPDAEGSLARVGKGVDTLNAKIPTLATTTAATSRSMADSLDQVAAKFDHLVTSMHQFNEEEAGRVAQIQNDWKQTQAVFAAQDAAKRSLGSTVDLSTIPGANLLGGKTLADFFRDVTAQFAGMSGVNLPQMAVEAFRAAAAKALQAAASPAALPGGPLTAASVTNVNVNVSGVWDARSKQELTDAVGSELVQRLKPLRAFG